MWGEDARHSPPLIVGYGNPGRGDDAAGWLVAEKVERRWGDRVEVTTLHQLDVVLAERLSSHQRVVFVDAEVTEDDTRLSPTRLEPATDIWDLTHSLTPQAILALASSLYNAQPEGYLVTVRAERFDFGALPSARTLQDVERAVDDIERILKLDKHE